MNGVDSLGLGQMASIEGWPYYLGDLNRHVLLLPSCYSACMAILCHYNGGGGGGGGG